MLERIRPGGRGPAAVGKVDPRSDALRVARYILGYNLVPVNDMHTRICPPFKEKEWHSAGMATEITDDGGNALGGGEFIPAVPAHYSNSDVTWLLSDHFVSSGIPSRAFHIHGHNSCVLEEHRVLAKNNKKEWSDDQLPRYTRLCLETLLTLDVIVESPWNLSDWLRRWDSTHTDYLRQIIAQAGPMSQHFAGMIEQQQQTDSTRLKTKLDGFIKNLSDLGIVTFNEDQVAEILKSSIEKLDELDSEELEDKSACILLYEKWCTLGTMQAGEVKQTDFWYITSKGKDAFNALREGAQEEGLCEMGGPMRLSSILLGLCVAQAISELYPLRRSSMRAVLENVVLNDLQWTGCVRDQIIWGWGGMMGRQDREPCTDLL